MHGCAHPSSRMEARLTHLLGLTASAAGRGMRPWRRPGPRSPGSRPVPGGFSAASAQAAPGDISTVAGNGTSGYSGDGAPPRRRRMNAPAGVAFSGSDLLIADFYTHTVRRVNSGGTINTLAGTGTAGYSGDGGAGHFGAARPARRRGHRRCRQHLHRGLLQLARPQGHSRRHDLELRRHRHLRLQRRLGPGHGGAPGQPGRPRHRRGGQHLRRGLQLHRPQDHPRRDHHHGGRHRDGRLLRRRRARNVSATEPGGRRGGGRLGQPVHQRVVRPPGAQGHPRRHDQHGRGHGHAPATRATAARPPPPGSPTRPAWTSTPATASSSPTTPTT